MASAASGIIQAVSDGADPCRAPARGGAASLVILVVGQAHSVESCTSTSVPEHTEAESARAGEVIVLLIKLVILQSTGRVQSASEATMADDSDWGYI